MDLHSDLNIEVISGILSRIYREKRVGRAICSGKKGQWGEAVTPRWILQWDRKVECGS